MEKLLRTPVFHMHICCGCGFLALNITTANIYSGALEPFRENPFRENMYPRKYTAIWYICI